MQNVISIQDSLTCLKEYKNLIQSEKQYVINSANQQGYILHKFKEWKKTIAMVKELGISQSTIRFKIQNFINC